MPIHQKIIFLLLLGSALTFGFSPGQSLGQTRPDQTFSEQNGSSQEWLVRDWLEQDLPGSATDGQGSDIIDGPYQYPAVQDTQYRDPAVQNAQYQSATTQNRPDQDFDLQGATGQNLDSNNSANNVELVNDTQNLDPEESSSGYPQVSPQLRVNYGPSPTNLTGDAPLPHRPLDPAELRNLLPPPPAKESLTFDDQQENQVVPESQLKSVTNDPKNESTEQSNGPSSMQQEAETLTRWPVRTESSEQTIWTRLPSNEMTKGQTYQSMEPLDPDFDEKESQFSEIEPTTLVNLEQPKIDPLATVEISTEVAPKVTADVTSEIASKVAADLQALVAAQPGPKAEDSVGAEVVSSLPPGNITNLDVSGMVEALQPKDGTEVTVGGGLFVWQDNILYRRNPDGSLESTGSFLDPNDTSLDEQGHEWLTQNEDGSVLINVSLRVWATINFAFNSDLIQPESEGVLETFSQALNRPALLNK
ncbi:MAG: hypothetical protein LBS44_04650, partial [Deltaproteobacteria bacterium]|nr:hypothetical protein [Deltaproteobacteria bacterium]